MWHYLSLSTAARLATTLYPTEGKMSEMPCTAMQTPDITEPKAWNNGTGTQTLVSVCGTTKKQLQRAYYVFV